MDDSQSSEVFSDNADLSCRKPSLMDDTAMKALVKRTKEALSKDVGSESVESFGQHFGSILEDCVNCVYQLLGKISNHLDDQNLEFTDLLETLEEVINILQLLTSFMKNVADSVTMTCKDMKTFPVFTGQILYAVFMHCKESATTYGFHLKSLESQLKDLFRTCHQLQAAYLLVLEKQFVFDLTVAEELDIFVEALEINLEIGEIVMSLDLKTLAEQWKGYTMICEKYYNYLLDRNIFQSCSSCLCKIIVSNIESTYALEDQALLRALKVAAFAIKILTKICHIFKKAVDRNLEEIVETMIFIHMHNPSYLKHQGKSAQYSQLLNTLVVCTSDAVVTELMDDNVFVNSILNYDLDKLNKMNTILGYALLATCLMKILTQKYNQELSEAWINHTPNIVELVFEIVPYCYPYITLELEFINHNNTKTTNLYEHILTHTSALAANLSKEQYVILERIMYEKLLGCCLYGGMFGSDLWVLLARNISNHTLTSNQIQSLCKIYRTLNSNKMFHNSPQQTNISFTIERLYKCLPKEEKLKLHQISDVFNNEEFNKVAKIRNFPEQVRKDCEETIVSELNSQMVKLCSGGGFTGEDMRCLIQTMKQASTCSYQVSAELTTSILDAWLKLCPKNYNILDDSIQNVWSFEFVKTLQELTLSVMHHLQRDSSCVTKILHVISNIITTCSLEVKLILLKIIINLALYNHQNDKIDSFLTNIFKEMFTEQNLIFKSKLFQRLRQLYRNKTIENLVLIVLNEDLELKSQWEEFLKEGKLKVTDKPLIEQCKELMHLDFTHKCVKGNIQNSNIDTNNITEVRENMGLRTNSIKSERFSGSFEFADSLFNIESDSEQPICKKAKLEPSEVEEVMCRIEKDVAILCNMRIDLVKNRVAIVCDKLRNLLE